MERYIILFWRGLTGILTFIAEWIKYLSQNLSYHEGCDFDGYVFNYNRPKAIMIITGLQSHTSLSLKMNGL